MWFFPTILLICIHEANGSHKYRGFKLEEDSQYVEGASYVRPFNGFTLCQWTKRASAYASSIAGAIFSYVHKDCKPWHSSDADCISVTLQFNKYLYVYVKGVRLEFTSFKYERPLQNWLHICICFSFISDDDYEYILYINGRKERSTIASRDGRLGNLLEGEGWFPGGGKVILGRRNDGKYPFTGWIVNLNMWDKKLLADEIRNIYHCQNSEPPLLINWNNRWSAKEGAKSVNAAVPCGCEIKN